MAITAILVLKKEVRFEAVHNHLRGVPKPHVMAVQFIMIGSGWASEQLDADGDHGMQSLESLHNLYAAARGDDLWPS